MPPARVRPLAPAGAGADARVPGLVAPHSYEAQQYRALRHLIEQDRRTSGRVVFAVSSADVGEGKTTTAINLAAALGQGVGTRVLLIDADLPRPAAAQRLGVERGAPGLAEAILEPQMTLAAVTRRHGTLNVSVVPTGRFVGAACDLLHLPRLGELLDEARTHHDFVIVDTPPLLPTPDARVIGKWIDGFLLVVSADRTPRKPLEEALNLLTPDRVVGLVFNNAPRPPARHLAYCAAGTERSRWWSRLAARLRGAPAPGARSWR